VSTNGSGEPESSGATVRAADRSITRGAVVVVAAAFTRAGAVGDTAEVGGRDAVAGPAPLEGGAGAAVVVEPVGAETVAVVLGGGGWGGETAAVVVGVAITCVGSIPGSARLPNANAMIVPTPGR
jgi:hypothetical protein